MINYQQIIDPLEHAIILWVQIYQMKGKVNSLHDLTNSEFFIFMLERMHNFQFVEPISYETYQSLQLGQRISRMKNVGRSIQRYCKYQLLMDSYNFGFNYVDMCLQNKEELIRLIIMFMGIIVKNLEIKRELEEFVGSGQDDSAGLLKTMAQYAEKMGQGFAEKGDSPGKQKRLITKLEIVEDQVQFYEDYTKQLEAKIQQAQEDSAKKSQRILELQKRGNQMLRRIQQLQVRSQEFMKEISKKQSQEQILIAKLNNNKQLNDDMINKMFKEIERQKEESQFYKNQLCKYQYVQSISKQTSLKNMDLCKEVEVLRSKNMKLGELLQLKDNEIVQLNSKYQQLLIENDSLKIRLELIEKECSHNHSYHLSPQQKSMVIHNPLSFSYQNSNQFQDWLHHQNMSGLQQSQDSLSITMRSSQSILDQSKLKIKAGKLLKKGQYCQQDNKQNDMSIMNKDHQDMNNLLSNITEEKSMQLCVEDIHDMMKRTQQQGIEIDVLLGIVVDLHAHNDYLRKEIKRYQLNQTKKAERQALFAQKVNKMFI